MSNSKSEDTHIFTPTPGGTGTTCSCGEMFSTTSEAQQHYQWYINLAKQTPEPPQDSPLGQGTSLDDYDYMDNLEHDYGFSDKEMQGINRAFAQQQAKLLQVIEDVIDGNEVDVEATRKHMESKGATEDQILSMELEADDTKEILDGVRKGLKKLKDNVINGGSL